ncbi:hypothetical protein [Magnetospirillum sp. UT-4]|uniref:hypothetical protein n=1 Tax=Magnetospirillum sp. UT-4 TaxID=2681467 RepID=UPI001385C278|nr:hypothetical protein [Magnetospirillum sp. UT-4]CAA7625765.1 conserved exported hypothetical protein [Magnetospirillum sp. UT-4]
MNRIAVAVACATLLAGCSTTPRPLAPDSAEGPTSYVCYSSVTAEPGEVYAIAARQCARSGQGVKGLIGQSWTPLRCGVLTPSVAAFQCGGAAGYYPSTGYFPTITP